MTNSRIADIFDEIADLLEFQGSNPFRVRAYRNGARIIRDLPESIHTVLADDSRKLTDLEGIGKDLAEKIQTLVETGALKQHQELLEQVPATVLDIMRVPGLGPKKAALLYKELNIATLEQLKAACEAEQVRQLKGFGAKTEQTILHGISIAAAANERIYWAEADSVATEIRELLGTCSSIEQLEFAGSYRRGKETVGDLDVLVVSQDVSEVMQRLGEYSDLAEVIGRGDTKMSIRTHKGLQIDLRVVPAESFGAALQYFTGSKDHNVAIRGLAKQRGLKINEYGVYRIDGDKEVYVAGATEEAVYATLDLPCFPPELREARREFEWAAKGELPELISIKDIRGDLHMHTTATDGRASLEEMVAAARERGLSYIAITDHSQRVSMARGLNAARLLAQWAEIDAFNKRLGKEFTVLKGIECDILEAGGMDLPDDVLAEADWVLASVHYGQQQSREQITQRILDAIENPWVTAIAHPTGRILNRREAYEVDIDAVFAAAAEHGKLLELNANPARLDLHDVHCAAAKSHGIPIVINTDAHSIDGLDCMRYGILQARRAGLTKEDIANTRTLPQLRSLIRKGRSKT
ncbi:MAG: DNA polymerase/3'-5' exonuclease PolX [Planctomycetaceae bacterium]|nr:DNA polymerase/3'-5' exonuclease PolX [Planctomycetales bacterium]MCB9875194.1 DNA polymerase/3'-5' exonuclease PolX [Planctomycetaceae bacterium]MCB9936782.1 DNA polymerase/3'-5' exonuclease PolX [Planctomycetaceae bacterium]